MEISPVGGHSWGDGSSGLEFDRYGKNGIFSIPDRLRVLLNFRGPCLRLPSVGGCMEGRYVPMRPMDMPSP